VSATLAWHTVQHALGVGEGEQVTQLVAVVVLAHILALNHHARQCFLVHLAPIDLFLHG